uniref:B1065G12.2 protein n=1 Tax=Oryza sativa subsp. japonica TaxID=39947 RepID=Q7F1Y2_ORYSJ|nr:B1065G12.2 [Oryza sativa Japonica Group]
MTFASHPKASYHVSETRVIDRTAERESPRGAGNQSDGDKCTQKASSEYGGTRKGKAKPVAVAVAVAGDGEIDGFVAGEGGERTVRVSHEAGEEAGGGAAVAEERDGGGGGVDVDLAGAAVRALERVPPDIGRRRCGRRRRRPAAGLAGGEPRRLRGEVPPHHLLLLRRRRRRKLMLMLMMMQLIDNPNPAAPDHRVGDRRQQRPRRRAVPRQPPRRRHRRRRHPPVRRRHPVHLRRRGGGGGGAGSGRPGKGRVTWTGRLPRCVCTCVGVAMCLHNPRRILTARMVSTRRDTDTPGGDLCRVTETTYYY